MQRAITSLVASALVAVALGAAAVWASSPHGGHDGHRSARRCAAEFDQVVGSGRGFGMAFVADQQGYPGPMHVLELADRLGLTAEQERRARELMDAMFTASRPRSAALLDAERRLRALFASGAADEESVRVAVAEVERARAELRMVHLRAHLAARDLLTAEQRSAYHEARWGADAGRRP